MLKLNLGCGEKMRTEPGWINIDCRKLVPVEAEFLRHDVRCIREIVQDGAVDEILADDILEHLCKSDQEQLIRDMAVVLKPGGRLTVKTPNIKGLIEWAKRFSGDEMKVSLRWYGGNDYPENTHRFVWPVADLKGLLAGVGLRVTRCETMEDTNILIEAVK